MTPVGRTVALRDIVVAVDGSHASRGALAWAAELAHTTGARIRLVHAVAQKYSSKRKEHEDDRRLLGRRLLRSSRADVSAVDPEIEVDTLLTGDPISTFLGTLSHTADLIVLGGHRSGALRDVLFGHKATRIVTESACPVLVWRERPADVDPLSHVVVGVDQSDSSTPAIEAAFWFADMMRVPLTAMHVRSAHSHLTPRSEPSRVPRQSCLDWLTARVDGPAAGHRDVTVHLHCLQADAEHVLRRASSTAPLVVVGSRGLGRMTGPILGSIGQSLVHASHGPVLVVPAVPQRPFTHHSPEDPS